MALPLGLKSKISDL